MEQILVLQNKHWQKQPYLGLFKRDILDALLEKLQLQTIEVLLGVRRSGKSTIFRLIINELMQKKDPLSILYLNLDDPFFTEVWHDAKELYSVIEVAEKLTGTKVHYIFLDEVQNVHDWEKFVKSIYDAKLYKKIFITGSNSNLLQGDYATLLSGRYLLNTVYPLTFMEYLATRGFKSNAIELSAHKADILKCVDDVLQFGSFPEIVTLKKKELKRDLLIGYYNTILLKDCLSKADFRNSVAFHELARYLLSNITHVYSYRSLARVVEGNDKTVKEFVRSLSNGYLIKEISSFSYSVKQQIHGRKKSYIIDNGLVNSVAFLFSENKGQLLENLVLTELLKAGICEIHFYQDKSECDFIIKYKTDFYGIQVCYEINEHNRHREIRGLTIAMDRYKLRRGIIITYDQEEVVDGKIMLLPFWKTAGFAIL